MMGDKYASLPEGWTVEERSPDRQYLWRIRVNGTTVARLNDYDREVMYYTSDPGANDRVRSVVAAFLAEKAENAARRGREFAAECAAQDLERAEAANRAVLG